MKITTTAGAVFLSGILMLAAFGGTKQRDWKVGRVMDSTMSNTIHAIGTVTNTSGTATASGFGTASTAGTGTTVMSGTATASGQSTSSTAIREIAVQSNELLIVADKYLYVVQDSKTYIRGALLRNAIVNRKHGCRFVVGEDINYAQEKGDLWVLDPDGKECKVPILRQQVR
jgi:hypothetical protein